MDRDEIYVHVIEPEQRRSAQGCFNGCGCSCLGWTIILILVACAILFAR